MISTVLEEGKGYARETRVGWPLPTVDTEANEDSRSTYEKIPFLVGSFVSSSPRYKRLLSCLGWSAQ
jgi:hypothetical protein